MEKGQITEIRIEDMLDDGRAFGRSDGLAVFVSGGAKLPGGKKARSTVPGDAVRIRVTKAKKSSAEAEALEITEASPDRAASACLYFGECGGCALRELSYDAQKKLKTEQVRSKIVRLGGLEDPKVNDIIGADTLDYYRNKAVFSVGPHGEVGFKKGKSNFVIDVEDCLLQTDAAMVCADALRQFLKSEPALAGRVIKQLTIRTAFGTGEVMAVIESEKKDIPQIEKLVEMLDDAVYSLGADEEGGAEDGLTNSASSSADASDSQRYSLESVALIHKGKCHIIAGKPTITEEFETDGGTLKFEISPQSFFQVNPGQMKRLYDKAAEYAGIPGNDLINQPYGCSETDNLPMNSPAYEQIENADTFEAAEGVKKFTFLDLYCGAGTIGIWLLNKLRAECLSAPEKQGVFENTRVIGIESVKPAILDANRNSVINGIINTRYFCGKAEEELPGMMGLAKLYRWNEVNERVEREPEIKIEKADVAVLDPPRAGCAEALLAAVAAAQPDRIVYVSCDPGTLSRDIRFLTANGYEFIEATPVDQFPWTTGIEVVCLLSRNKC